MIRWGISAGFHDASISVIEDNEILFAGHAERYSGIKNDKNINLEIIADALQYGYPNIIYWYEKPWIKNIRRLIAGQDLKKNTIKKDLAKLGITAPIKYTTHHKAHAAAGMFTSPFINANVLVIDAIGELTTTSIWSGALGKRFGQYYPKSLGLFYSAMTQRCGLKPTEEEYILMGMAAYGNPDRFYNAMKPLLDTNLHKGCRDFLPGLYEEYDLFGIAAATQKIYEEEFEKLLVKTKEKDYTNNLVLMGGCALNCVANTKALEYFNNVWIMPNPGDAGSSLGAILAHTQQHVEFTPYLGYNIKGKYPNKQLLNELLTNKIAGVANGRAEFGPRALGNRSLLADPRGPDIKDKVNEIKRRQKFRPFAPVILKEDANKWFEMPCEESPFMQYVAKCKRPDLVPAIVHKDGTSRVQTVTRKQHPGLYQLLVDWKDKTGCPMLLNTSLNIKGKPIVNTYIDGQEFAKRYGVKVF
tara:strand:- start:2373 stop:3785 length:1413 start_codon:yes stop_codon:yes gene_type:complete